MNDSATRTPRLAWLATALLLPMVLLVAVYKGWDRLFPPTGPVAVADPACDLHQGPCVATLASGATVRFGITPTDLPSATPLRLRVETDGIDPASVEVDFRGVDMYMGFVRPKLARIGPGRFEGNGMLPVCIRERMTWEARVLLHQPGETVAAAYRFDTTGR